MSSGGYRAQASALAGNSGQQRAYDSTGHCVVVAGPGSGKTKTLTLKLARMLEEDVEDPRGIACITYNNECARELETRLYGLGLEPSRRLFVGTVHSFSLTQVILPHAQALDLGIPVDFKIATKGQQAAALEDAYAAAIGPGVPSDWKDRMNRYRRSILDRTSKAWRETDARIMALAERYEQELRGRGVIDFEDMPLLALRALQKHPWLQRALLAKYPILAVDEYQDLGRALHTMVMELCFGGGVRLFAVGDPDQSIYGFTGSDPELFNQLSNRPDVERVPLTLNYRSGHDIVSASQLALGAPRGYEAAQDAPKGTIYFHAFGGNYDAQAVRVFTEILASVAKRRPKLDLSDIAILYPAGFIGDAIAEVAKQLGIAVIRSDSASLFPRGSRLMTWIERCAIWCSGGWKTGDPRLMRLQKDALSIFSEGLPNEEAELSLVRSLVDYLWNNRTPKATMHDWLVGFAAAVLSPLAASTPRLDDERETFDEVVDRVKDDGLTLEGFAGGGTARDRLNLSSLHSSKGREFEVVVMFGIDEGRVPRTNPSPRDLQEFRQLFYVGLTRAKSELHIVSSLHRTSRFVSDLIKRLA
jgi:DNA helicase-2/ATP-dependent DNA helicase PcrA